MKTQTRPKFEVGQVVVFINSYGVNWGEKTITGREWDDVRGNIYHYSNSDTPWFATSERNLYEIDDADEIAASTSVHVASCCQC